MVSKLQQKKKITSSPHLTQRKKSFDKNRKQAPQKHYRTKNLAQHNQFICSYKTEKRVPSRYMTAQQELVESLVFCPAGVGEADRGATAVAGFASFATLTAGEDATD